MLYKEIEVFKPLIDGRGGDSSFGGRRCLVGVLSCRDEGGAGGRETVALEAHVSSVEVET